MEPFVRQGALEVLLINHQKVKPHELAQALRFGLTDPDLNISELAWNFVQEHGRVEEFKKELYDFVFCLNKEGSQYSLGLAEKIQAALKK